MRADPRFAKALRFAMEAHEGQFYYTATGPESYILHPIRVALAVFQDAQVVALLHDVFEDTMATAPRWLLPEEVTALALLTRVKPESYRRYIERIALGPSWGAELAREVKLADLRENLDHIRPSHREGLRECYEDALRVLGQATG